MRALAALAVGVTEAPWALGPADREALALAGFDDDAVVHAVALSAYFGHLNRIADATGVPLDYVVSTPPPDTEPAVPALLPAATPVTRQASLSLARRPTTAAALTAWTNELFVRDPEHLPRSTREAIVATVGALLGAPLTVPGPLEPTLRAVVETVTLAPWQLDDDVFASLRTRGWTDAQLFDLVAVTSTATVVGRIDVALRALAPT